MSTPPRDLSFYKITQVSAYVQWYSTGADTNYADVICYPLSATTNVAPYYDASQIVCSLPSIHTPNTQYYSAQITGLTPGTAYVAAVRAKYDPSGTGLSAFTFLQFSTVDSPSGDPAGSSLVKQLVYVKTNIAGYFFDAILQTNYSRSLTITQHPVETGAAISDHAYVNPVELTMQIGMSDAVKSIIPGQFSQGESRSLTAFQVLAQLQSQRIPLSVMTRLGGFTSMLIETIAVPDDYTTQYGLKATVTMREIFVATVQTVKVSARPHVTDSTNRGPVEPQKPNQSAAFQIEQLVKGYVDKYLGANGGIQ